MLRELYIKNFALIKELRIDFRLGLNIITGETGSGKSIMIDALSLCLGKRGDKIFVKKGESKCMVEAVFSTENPEVIKILNENSIDIEEDIIIYREISDEGRSIARVNGRTVNLSVIKELSKYLLNIHGQNEHDNLIDNDNQLKLLDSFGGEEVSRLKSEYILVFEEYKDILKEVSELRIDKTEGEIEKERDFLSYIIGEIVEANIKENEIVNLEDRLAILNNSSKIFGGIDNSYSWLYDKDENALSNISKAIKEVEFIENMYPNAKLWGEQLRDAFYQIEDVAKEINSAKEDIVYDENELNAIHERISFINGIYRKYGGSHDAMKAELLKAQKNIEILENIANIKEELNNKLSSIKMRLKISGEMLSAKRKVVALSLSDSISKEMLSLSMENVKFNIEFEEVNFREYGLDKIEFKVSFNKGEEAKTFSKVASGGEVSRFVLSLKSIISKYDDIDTMLFDEIDTGVSGLAAENIGKKLKEISKLRQVLSITHLPQIASCADLHYKVMKNEDENSVYTSIIKLENNERVIEIAKMMSGSKLTDLAIKNAKELLELNQGI